MKIEEMNNEMVPILEAWRNLQNQIAGLLAGKPVRCFDETMSAMDNALRRLNAGEPSITSSIPDKPGLRVRDTGEPGPRCPKCGKTALQFIRDYEPPYSFVRCKYGHHEVFPINEVADFAQFFPAERQEGWCECEQNTGHPFCCECGKRVNPEKIYGWPDGLTPENKKFLDSLKPAWERRKRQEGLGTCNLNGNPHQKTCGCIDWMSL